jgi:MFS family permease
LSRRYAPILARPLAPLKPAFVMPRRSRADATRAGRLYSRPACHDTIAIASARRFAVTTSAPAAVGRPGAADEIDGSYAWGRLAASLLLSTIGGVAMWSIAVVLPSVQGDFGVDRADASLSYTAVMLGFVVGGPIMGRLSDRRGIVVPVTLGALMLGGGFVAASQAAANWQFALAHGLLIGVGGAASFGPVIADISLWFARRRGIAVAICSSGSYLAGTVWPLVIEPLAQSLGWRRTYCGIGVFCVAAMLPLALALRRRLSGTAPGGVAASRSALSPLPAGVTPLRLQLLLMLAGIACCAAMAMPQVHIVAYCVDLGFGSANGARMLSLMLGAGIVSRLSFGLIVDRIGPLSALLLSSSLQATALLLYFWADGLMSLYAVTALFGLVQGGIVLTYTLIVREYYPAAEAGTRIGLVLSATLAGMAIGGWISGAIFDATLSYRTAFLGGFAWNLVNIAIVLWLLARLPRRRYPAWA